MSKHEMATLGGGCFWCVEAVFVELNGIEKVVSGYMGGHVENPTYEQICTKTTGHAEVVQVVFDPEVVSYETVLEVFFTTHDPTTLNRQGADVGPQYRSAIFYHDEGQKESADSVIARFNKEEIWANPIVTEVTAASAFYPAEDYHQNYYANNPYQGYCMAVIRPKVAKLRKLHLDKLRR